MTNRTATTACRAFPSPQLSHPSPPPGTPEANSGIPGSCESGHSLIEVTIAAMLASLLLAVMAAWAIGLVGSARQGAEVAAGHTSTMATRATLASDLRSAGSCDTVTPAVARADGTVLRVWQSRVGESQSGTTLVSWRLHNASLQRAEQTVSSGCEVPALPDDASQWRTMSSHITAEAGGFAVTQGGTETTVDGDTPAPDRIVQTVTARFESTDTATGVVMPLSVAGGITKQGLAIAR